MRRVRFRQEVTTTQAIGFGEPTARPKHNPGRRPLPRTDMIATAKEHVFFAGEEIETLDLPVEGKLRLVSSRVGKGQGAILDEALLGVAFDFIDERPLAAA